MSLPGPETGDVASHILVVDDNALNRLKLAKGLQRQGHQVTTANDGAQALSLLEERLYDLILLDIIMPVMDGYAFLEHVKTVRRLRDIPIIVISAVDEMDSVVRCIELGAADYLPKQFEPVLLRARIEASLEKKRLRDQERAALRQLQAERDKSERLLLNILPAPIAERLKQGESVIADHFEAATVLFADIVGFTGLSADMPPESLVALLNEVFSCFDDLADQHGLEKIKTIGDAYLLVGGLPEPRPDHATAVADMALDMLAACQEITVDGSKRLHLRIGIHTGPVVAGIIGTRKFSYDLWGNTVNLASRMQTHGVVDQIQVSAATHALLAAHYHHEPRGPIAVKGARAMETYLLLSRRGRDG